MEELGLKAKLNSARKEIYHLPSWCKKEEEDVFQVPFDPTTGLLSSNKLTGPEKSMRWDLRIGARVRLTGGPYEGDEGVIIAKSAEGHYKVRFSESIHPIFNVRRRTFCLWLGCWWIETVLLGHGIVPGGKIPFINASRKAEDKLTRRQREGKPAISQGQPPSGSSKATPGRSSVPVRRAARKGEVGEKQPRKNYTVCCHR